MFALNKQENNLYNPNTAVLESGNITDESIFIFQAKGNTKGKEA